MSNHRWVSSLGQPYFAFVADGIGDINTLPSAGLAAITAEFRVDALPTMKASVDEIHPFFAYNHDIQTQVPIFEVGITPNGALKALAKSGGTYKTRDSLFVDTSAWNTVQITYGVQAPGNWDVRVNGVVDNSVTDGAPTAMLPNSGYNSRILLFNGRDGLARTGISIRNLTATFVGTGPDMYEWKFLERGGDTLTPVLTLFDPGSLSAGVARAQWYNPFTASPWGAVPTGSVAGAYARGLSTDYVAVAKPVTAYTQVAA